MITLRKLESLKPSTRFRKAAYICRELGKEARKGKGVERSYLIDTVKIGIATFSSMEKLSSFEVEWFEAKVEMLAACSSEELPWICDDLYFRMMGVLGVTAADWDFSDNGDEQQGERKVFPIRPYLDHVRSPFNVGSVFRSAESFCCDRVLLSEETADPDHPRAKRTGRGCTEMIPWERVDIEVLEKFGPVFALETGGTAIDDFPFPEEGVVIIGSEEMGVSPDALALADRSLGRVSIPTFGRKGSINLSTAFGILIQRWSSAIDRDN